MPHPRSRRPVRDRACAVVASAVLMVLGGTAAEASDTPTLVAVPTDERVTETMRVQAGSLEEETRAYVSSVYSDLFGRAPDPVGLETWTRALLAGTPRIAVANGITYSREFRSGLIADAYDWYLGRGPDPAGLESWLGAMGLGLTISQIESGFIASPEYYDLAGGTPESWVDTLYADVLGRSPAPSEVQAWADGVRRGTDRRQVALGFLLSWEHLSEVVDGYYQTLLGRGLDPQGQQAWVQILQGGGRDEAIIGGIIASDEYWWGTGEVEFDHIAIYGPGAIYAGEWAIHSARAVDAEGDFLDITNEAVFAVDGDPHACDGPRCFSTVPGAHTVTASWENLDASASLTVFVGPLASVVLSPPAVSTTAGTPVQYLGRGLDAFGNDRGDVTASLWIRAAEGTITCTDGGSCLPLTVGRHTLYGTVLHIGIASTTAVVDVAYPPAPAGLTLMGWGDNTYGQLALPLGSADRLAPTLLEDEASWRSVSAGSQHTAAIRTDGRLWSWGDGSRAQQGFAWGAPSSFPGYIGTDSDWERVFAAGKATLALKSDGTLWGWGDNTYSVLGQPQLSLVPQPTQVSGGGSWAEVSIGAKHVVALRPDGTLWLWGTGFNGQMGDGFSFTHPKPTQLGTETWTAVAAGGAHSLAVRSDGALWAWGSNQSGQFGNGAAPDAIDFSRALRPLPVQVGTETDWASVYAGTCASAGIKTDGTLWTWGCGSGGQIGDGDLQRHLTPVQVGTDTDWSWVAFGGAHIIGMKSDGTLWSWGTSSDGQVGDGTLEAALTPVQVSPGTIFTTAAAGGQHTVALRP